MNYTKKSCFKTPSREDLIVNIFVYLFSLCLIVVMLYPFLNILAISLNDVTDTMYGLTGIFPRQFTISNYTKLLSDSQIYVALRNSLLRTVIGTFCAVFGCFLCAYLMYHKTFVFRKPFTVMLIITMFVSGGMIPDFVLMKELNLINTFAVYIVPNFVFAFNIILIMNAMNELPESITESAQIDGAGDIRIMFTIMLPLLKPVIATVLLFCAVGQWNSWFDVMLYNDTNANLSTLQYELQKKMQAAVIGGGGVAGGVPEMTPLAIQATMTMIATLPILFVYPFLQKYFVKGVTLGSVKG